MTSKSDVRKLVKAETERLGFTMELINGRWLVTNPNNGRTGTIPLQAMGRGLDNYKTEIRSLLHDHPTKPAPMVAATDLATQKVDTMPRDTWWSVEALVAVLPGAENADEAGTEDANDLSRQHPAAGVCDGVLLGMVSSFVGMVPVGQSMTSLTAERAAGSSTRFLPEANAATRACSDRLLIARG